MGIPTTIAIDGPAASGKSTLAARLAKRLGFLYFDSGVMYRAVTWYVLHQGMDLNDEEEVSEVAEEIQIDVRPPSQDDGREYDVWIDHQDITWEIRRPEIDEHVSQISAYPGVRQALSTQQRRIGLRGQVVMVGRDIGTVILPDAALKIYLDASVEERARRRYEELLQRGEPADYQAILEKMQARDRIDSTRAIAPLRPADDAVIIDSDRMEADQVFNYVKNLVFRNNPA